MLYISPANYFIYSTHFKHRSDDEIVNVAKSMDKQLKGEYNVFLKNCQQFACYCQYGKEICLQKKIFIESFSK